MLAQTGSTSNEFLFAGGQYDATIGSYHFGARYYDTAAGRFSSKDSFEGSSQDPLTLNHYAYVRSDPVDRIDPSGHEDIIATLQTIALYVGFHVSNFLTAYAPAFYAAVSATFGAWLGTLVVWGMQKEGFIPQS
jgi:RHS repeat-associated protein